MGFSSKLGEATIEIRAQANKLKTDMKKATTVVQAASLKMKTALASIDKGTVILAATAALVAFGKVATSAAASLEKMKVSFEAMLGSSEAADKLVDSLNKFSAKTPFQLEDIGAATKQLLAAGVGVDDVTNKLQMLGDISAGANVPLKDMASIFGKISNKGRAYTEELLQLSDRGIPILQVLSEQLGVTKNEVFELASQGKLTSEVMLNAFQVMTGEGGVFYEQMIKQSETLSGKWSTLKDNFQLFAAALGETLLPSLKLLADILIKVFQALTKVITKIKEGREAITNMASAIKDTAVSGFETMGNAASDAAETVKDKMYDMWDYVVGHSVVPDMVDGVVEEFDRMKKGMVEETKAATAEVKKEFKDLEKETTTSANKLSSKSSGGASKKGSGGNTKGLDILQNVFGAIQSGDPQAAFSSILNSVTSLESGISDLGGSVTNLGDNFGGLESIAGNAFSGIEGQAGGLVNSLTSMFGGIGGGGGGGLLGGMGGGGLFGGISNMFSGLLGGIGDIFGGLFGGIGGLFGGFFADGGRPPVGKVSVVGENGPELFVPNTSGTVIPNHEMGNSGGTINLHQTFVGVDDQITQRIREETPSIIQAAKTDTINSINRGQVKIINSKL